MGSDHVTGGTPEAGDPVEGAPVPGGPTTGAPAGSTPAAGDVPARPYDVFDRHCPSRDALGDLTGRWAVLALAGLLDGPLRFGEVRRRVDGVSDKMLARTLQALERDGLVLRTQHSVMPPVVDYRLTGAGRGAAGHCAALLGWVQENTGGIRAARDAWDDARAGSGG